MSVWRSSQVRGTPGEQGGGGGGQARGRDDCCGAGGADRHPGRVGVVGGADIITGWESLVGNSHCPSILLLVANLTALEEGRKIRCSKNNFFYQTRKLYRHLGM